MDWIIKSGILCLLILCSGCKKNNKKIYSNFPENQQVSGEKIDNITVYGSGNVNLKVLDTFLIIQRDEAPFFKIYSTISYELLTEFGYEGRGPSEFISPELINQLKEDDETVSIFSVYDYDRRELSEINIKEAIKNKAGHIKKIKIPKTTMQLNYFFFWDQDFLLASQVDGGRFVLHNNESEKYKKIPYLPETDFEINNDLKKYIYKSSCVVNKDLNRIVAAPIFLGQIDIFDLQGAYLKSTTFDSEDTTSRTIKEVDGKTLKNFSKLKYQITQMEVGSDYIYCLNYNNNGKQLYENEEMSNIKIQVFDWDGNTIKEYILNDKRFISSFAIDEKNKKIYGYCPNEMENNIIIYDFKN